jgi:hypothetical protein
MFFAPVNPLPVSRVAILPALTLGNDSAFAMPDSIRHPDILYPDALLFPNDDGGFPLILKGSKNDI